MSTRIENTIYIRHYKVRKPKSLFNPTEETFDVTVDQTDSASKENYRKILKEADENAWEITEYEG